MSWKRINNGLISEHELMASMALGINAIEIDRTNSDIVYAGTTKGLFRTANKGEQWAIPSAILLSAVFFFTLRSRRSSYWRSCRSLEKFRQRKHVAGDKPWHCDAQYSRPRHESQESADTLRWYE